MPAKNELPEQLALLDQPGGHIHQVSSLHIPNLQVFSFSVEHLNSEKKGTINIIPTEIH